MATNTRCRGSSLSKAAVEHAKPNMAGSMAPLVIWAAWVWSKHWSISQKLAYFFGTITPNVPFWYGFTLNGLLMIIVDEKQQSGAT